MQKRADGNRISKLLFAGGLCLYFLLLLYLFMCELTVYPTDPSFRFESDTYVHVKFAVEDGYFYSLSSFVYYLLYKLPFGTWLIAGFLSLSVVAAIPLTKRLLKVVADDMPEWVADVASFSLNFVMGFYIPVVNRQHYIGWQNANMWHNSTYILMKTCAVVTMIVFVKLYREYSEKIDFRGWIFYTLLLAVTTAFKPSFFTVFAPTLAIMLLVDLCSKRAGFSRVFIMALSVVPSFGVMIAESLALFDSGESKMVIAPFKAFFERGDHPKASLLISPLFIILVIILCFNRIKSDRLYFDGLLFLVIGFTETALIAETGARGSDGNFMWGYSIALFFAFTVSFYRLWQSFKAKEIKTRMFTGCMAVFSWHVISGLWHFLLLLQGFTYFK
ncbi:MAG: hypothetical protein K6E19_07760 [Lachnospiraceae bacterium]|nr:hypothetical protein [Lachnospiraceae bacterium]